jgi:hypothetical protein
MHEEEVRRTYTFSPLEDLGAVGVQGKELIA